MHICQLVLLLFSDGVKMAWHLKYQMICIDITSVKEANLNKWCQH